MKQEIKSGVISRIAPYSDAIIVNSGARILLSSGTPGIDERGDLSEDFTSQAEQAWDNIAAVMSSVGLHLADIVRVTHFLTRREDLEAYRRICETKLAGAAPVSTLVFVAGLPWPEMLVEIQVDAVVP